MVGTSWAKAVALFIALIGLTQQEALGQRVPASTDSPSSELELQARSAGKPGERSLNFLLVMRRYDAALEAMQRTDDLNVVDAEGRLPLTIAARDQSADAYDMVEALLTLGAKPDERDATGRTALHYASEAGTLAVVQLLVDRYGADPDAPRLDSEGEPIESEVPVTIALVSGNPRIAAFLEKRGASAPELTPIQELDSRKQAHYKRLTASQNDPRLAFPGEHSTRVKDSALIESSALALSEMGAPDIYVRHKELELTEFLRLLRDPETRGLDGTEMWRRAREHADGKVDSEAYAKAAEAFIRSMMAGGDEQ